LRVVDRIPGVDQHPDARLDGQHTGADPLDHLVEDGGSVGRGVRAPHQTCGQRLPRGPALGLSGLVEALHHAQQNGVLLIAGQAHGGDQRVERAQCELQRVPGR